MKGRVTFLEHVPFVDDLVLRDVLSLVLEV